MHITIRSALVSAALGLAVVPTAAMAGDRDNARVAIGAAKAKIDANEKAGVGGEAADVMARARAALDNANKQFKDSDEDHALTAAREASALADLAAATSEYRKLTAERDQLAQAR